MWGIHRIWGNHRIFAYETKYSAEVSSIFFPVYFFEMYSVFKNLILRLFKNIIYFPEYKFKYIFHNPMGDCDQLKLHSSHLTVPCLHWTINSSKDFKWYWSTFVRTHRPESQRYFSFRWRIIQKSFQNSNIKSNY